MECLEVLTQKAIDQSSEIEVINQQLEFTDERQDYARARQWTHYITLDPIRLVQNVLGGGDVQRQELAIADLELREAELIRRRESEAEFIAGEIVGLVLSYEKLDREAELIESQLQNHLLQVAIQEARYRTGQGSTRNMLMLWQRSEDLAARCIERRIGQAQDRRQLEIWIGEADFETGSDPVGSSGCSSDFAASTPGTNRGSAGEAGTEE